MKPTLQKLYNGEIRPDLHAPETDEFLDNRNKFNKNFAALKDFMPELEPKITALLDDHDMMCEAERKDMFQYGFDLGVRLVLEALSQA